MSISICERAFLSSHLRLAPHVVCPPSCERDCYTGLPDFDPVNRGTLATLRRPAARAPQILKPMLKPRRHLGTRPSASKGDVGFTPTEEHRSPVDDGKSGLEQEAPLIPGSLCPVDLDVDARRHLPSLVPGPWYRGGLVVTRERDERRLTLSNGIRVRPTGPLRRAHERARRLHPSVPPGETRGGRRLSLASMRWVGPHASASHLYQHTTQPADTNKRLNKSNNTLERT